MAAEFLFGRGSGPGTAKASWQTFRRNNRNKSQIQFLYFTIRASHSTDKKNKVYKQLGLFSLKKKIEDAVFRAEVLAPTALELEEERRIRQEEMIRDYNLWDDPSKSNEILVKLADSAKVVDSLKDLKYKANHLPAELDHTQPIQDWQNYNNSSDLDEPLDLAHIIFCIQAEEAKLISQLAEMDAINYGLFKQAYDASLDVSKFLDQYEMSKLLRGPYDLEGACVTIKAGLGGIFSEIWAEQLLQMYTKWAEKQGYRARLVEKCCCKNGGIKSATIELEFGYAFGYLSGERGVHLLISCQSEFVHQEAALACVDVIPLFLETTYDLQISDEHLIFSSPLSLGVEQNQTEPTVCIQHIPTSIIVQSSGERSHFANKIKALNRLKAKLLVIAKEQGVSSISCINRDAIVDIWSKETRRYVSHPYKLVQDVKSGIQLPDLNSVLDGNIGPFLGAHINRRQANDTD